MGWQMECQLMTLLKLTLLQDIILNTLGETEIQDSIMTLCLMGFALFKVRCHQRKSLTAMPIFSQEEVIETYLQEVEQDTCYTSLFQERPISMMMVTVMEIT